MTAHRFHFLHAALQRHIDAGLLPGAVARVHHRGETVYAEALGARAPGAEPMAPDSLFRIYSMAAALGPLPLVHQPGTMWEYSRATDVLGAVLEAVCQAPLAALLQRLVLGPLGMHDTAFHVPAAQQGRLAEPFAHDPQTGTPVALIDVTVPPVFESGGGGLVSTAGDYARFLALLLGGGTHEGVRLASRKTIAWMTSDHLGSIPVQGMLLPAGYGFGLGVAVRRADGLAARQGSAGTYGWSGLSGTLFFVDPSEDLFGVLLTQAPHLLDPLCDLFPNLVYGAL